MSLTRELKERHADLWRRMVFHPFIVEMGEGTLRTKGRAGTSCRLRLRQ